MWRPGAVHIDHSAHFPIPRRSQYDIDYLSHKENTAHKGCQFMHSASHHGSRSFDTSGVSLPDRSVLCCPASLLSCGFIWPFVVMSGIENVLRRCRSSSRPIYRIPAPNIWGGQAGLYILDTTLLVAYTPIPDSSHRTVGLVLPLDTSPQWTLLTIMIS